MIIAKLALVANWLKNAVPWQVWAIAGAILLLWMWGNDRYRAGQEAEYAERERAILEAVVKAVEAERHAQAQHEGREEERHSHTDDLREAAAKAPTGSKTQAVLDALRNS